ncbi:MAG TPA: hypothetical protein VFI95_16980 [Terriglobales bacterium]|nr:hypothetical protein [Terriglobales bacterium]
MRGSAWWRAVALSVIAATLMLFDVEASAQERSGPEPNQQANLADSVHQLQSEMQELRAAIAELRAETQQYRDENLALRRQLRGEVSQPVNTKQDASPNGSSEAISKADYGAPTGTEELAGTDQSGQEKTASIQEQLDFLNGKIDEQYQTKVESASKYRVRLSGIVLFNLLANRGSVDDTDFPHVAAPIVPGESNTSLGGSLRQSLLGFEVFGPTLAGAKTRGEIQFDFSGGFPQAPNGVTYGIMRLRTANIHLDWKDTTLVVGQDALFFAPLAPTSIASLAVPPLAYTGNLWSWTPQVRVEHRFHLSEDSNISVQGGVLDPLTGEFPGNSFYREPLAGESSSRPAVGTRVAWNSKFLGQPVVVGAGGYYSRQNWGFGRIVNGWSGNADFDLPLSRLFSLSGEFYRGRAIGGLGAALGRSIVWSGDLTTPNAVVRGLDDMGGWSQLKFKPFSKLEFNVAAGQDSAFNNEVREFPAFTYFGTIGRNRGIFGNFIYRPRSDLLFSAEYQRLQTDSISSFNTANHVSLSMGVLF